MPEQEKSLEKLSRERLEEDAYNTLIKAVFAWDKWTCRNPFCGSMKNLSIT
jgi:hypothetical protein